MMNMQTLETIRRRTGLPRQLFLTMIGSKRKEDLIIPDSDVDPKVMRNAVYLDSLHDEFLGVLKSNLAREAQEPFAMDVDGTLLYSTRQISRSLGIGEFALTTMRHRGAIPVVYVQDRLCGYRQDVVDEILIGPLTGKRVKSPVAEVFIRWLEDREGAAAPAASRPVPAIA